MNLKCYNHSLLENIPCLIKPRKWISTNYHPAQQIIYKSDAQKKIITKIDTDKSKSTVQSSEYLPHLVFLEVKSSNSFSLDELQRNIEKYLLGLSNMDEASINI